MTKRIRHGRLLPLRQRLRLLPRHAAQLGGHLQRADGIGPPRVQQRQRLLRRHRGPGPADRRAARLLLPALPHRHVQLPQPVLGQRPAHRQGGRVDALARQRRGLPRPAHAHGAQLLGRLAHGLDQLMGRWWPELPARGILPQQQHCVLRRERVLGQ